MNKTLVIDCSDIILTPLPYHDPFYACLTTYHIGPPKNNEALNERVILRSQLYYAKASKGSTSGEAA